MNRLEYINSPVPIDIELNSFLNTKKECVIFDIGACEGEDSIRYSRMFPHAKICSFEPLPSNVLKIRDSIRSYELDDVITVYPIALSDKNGTADFFVSSGTPAHSSKDEDWEYGNKSSSLLSPSTYMQKEITWLKFEQKIEIQTQRLDSFCSQNNIELIDFIHLDVQGAELLVLKGAGAFLKNVKTIWMEVERVELYSHQPLIGDVEQFMLENGFVKIVDTVSEVSGDQFYVNKKMVSFSEWLSYMSRRVKRKLKYLMNSKG